MLVYKRAMRELGMAGLSLLAVLMLATSASAQVSYWIKWPRLVERATNEPPD